MNEKEFNGLILAELVKIANDVFTNEYLPAPIPPRSLQN